MKNRAHYLLFLLLVTVAAYGQTATFSTYSVNLGTVNINSDNQISISLTNTSTTTNLTISSLTVAPQPPFSIGGDCTQTNLVVPGDTCNLDINFAPNKSGVVTGAVTLNSNDPVHAVQTVALSGNGLWVTLTPNTTNFGTVNVGATATSAFNVTNYAGAPVPISISTSGAPFSQTNNCGNSLDSGSTCALTVSFMPTAASTFNGTLTVAAGAAGTQTSSLSGTGTTQTGLVVSPASTSINTGDSKQFVAYPTYSDGTTGTTPLTATWSSSSAAVAQIDVYGLVVGDGPGTTSITATSGGFTGSATLRVNAATSCLTNNRIDMKVLVVTRGQKEASFPAVTTALNYLHMPYTVFDFSTGAAITQSMLYSGCHAFYSGVIFPFFESDGFDPVHNTYKGYDFSTGAATAVPLNGFNVLQAFEGMFKIRQLNWFALPAPSVGFNWASNAVLGDTAVFTSAAQPLFPYVNSSTPLIVDPHAFVYLTTPYTTGTALLTDTSGNVLSLDYPFTDNSNREFLSNTFDSNQYMRHDIILSYGLVNWVTKGLFIGEKHIYFTPQEDDWGIDDDIWTQNDGTFLVTGATPPPVGSYPTCGPTQTPPTTFSTITGMGYRINANDAQALVNWQNGIQANPLFKNVKLYNAFNSCGLQGDDDPNCGSQGSPYSNDTLTAWTQNTANSSHFGWINHTYEHEDLQVQADGVSPQTYAEDYFQINQNIVQNQLLGFANFNGSYMVTPDISGLNFLPALQAMVDNGVQYLVSDTSCSAEKFVGQTPTCFTSSNNGPGPGFNLPIINSNNPIKGQTATGNIYEIPRRPSNLFYNVGDPGGWQSEYQCIYNSQPPYSTYTTQNIEDFISGKTGIYPNFVDLMMQGDADPEMFHQTNLRAYDGVHSLLSDLLTETFNLYQSYFSLPVKSMDMDNLGQWMLNNRAVDNSGVVGTVNNGSTRTVTLTVTNAATIPVTGLGNKVSATTEQYGTQFISHVGLTAGQTLTQSAP